MRSPIRDILTVPMECQGRLVAVYLLCTIACKPATLWAQAGAKSHVTINSARFEQDSQGLVQIDYRVDNPQNRTFDVSLSLSKDGGRTFALAPKALSGDVSEVSGSGQKRITWVIEKDYPMLSGRNFVFAVEGIPRMSPEEQGRFQAAQRAAENTRRAGIRWVRIPGGTFTMGSADYNLQNSKPLHRVAVKSFELAKTLVTNNQYKACVEAHACTGAHVFDGTCVVSNGVSRRRSTLPASFQRDDQPVVCVDWEQAKAYAEWVGGRLPSEAEWEYAARSAGHDWKFPWGNEEVTCDRAVIDDGGPGCGKSSTWPVCLKTAGNTTQGLCDMTGNVLEWIEDWYHPSYDGAPTNGSAWESPSGSTRVSRGSSWTNLGSLGRAQSTRRNYVEPRGAESTLGFRPARSLP